MNDKDVQLFIERNRSVDTIGFVEEDRVNSISNRLKSFNTDFEGILANESRYDHPDIQVSPDVRTIIYATNAIESLNSTYRKLNRLRSIFPSNRPY